MEDYIDIITEEGISIAGLILKGLNDENNAVSDINITQWLASQTRYNGYGTANYYLKFIKENGNIYYQPQYNSKGESFEGKLYVRPVVTLKTSNYLIKVDDTWQITE